MSLRPSSESCRSSGSGANEPVEVHLYATLRPVTGGGRVDLTGSYATIGEVLEGLMARFPALRVLLFARAGSVRPMIAIMVDGRDIRHLDGLNTAVAAGSTIDIFPPVAGG